jgi:hypothetical protein
MIYRQVAASLLEFISRIEEHKNVLIVQGARQVGKTYLIEQTLSSLSQTHVSFNLEHDLIFRDEIDSSRDFEDFTVVLQQHNFIPGKGTILYIDEAQESKKLGSYLRFMKEKWSYATVIISGSSITKLFKDNERVPVGRIEYLHVTPLNFEEFLGALQKIDLYHDAAAKKWCVTPSLHRALLELYDEYLLIGGLPAIVEKYAQGISLEKLNIARKEIYLSQQDDFYRKEPNLKPHLFKDGTQAVSDLLGLPFSLTRISPNHRDARATLETLNEWLITYSCQQKALATTSEPRPKVYLYDIGLARQLRETSLPTSSLLKTKDSMLRNALGGLVENAIYLDAQQGKGFLNDISGWRNSPRNPVEVDFIIKASDRSIPVEVKCSETLDQRHFSSIKIYLERTKNSLGILVSTAPYQEILYKEGIIINLSLYAVNFTTIKEVASRTFSNGYKFRD